MCDFDSLRAELAYRNTRIQTHGHPPFRGAGALLGTSNEPIALPWALGCAQPSARSLLKERSEYSTTMSEEVAPLNTRSSVLISSAGEA